MRTFACFELTCQTNIKPFLVLLLSSLLLAGCGGNGSNLAGDNSTISSDDGNEIEPTLVQAKEAKPGDIVTLQGGENVDTNTIADYSWSQLDGPAVLLSDAGQRTAHFVMPPKQNEEELTFIVDISHGDGSIVSEMHTVKSSRHGHDDEEPMDTVITDQYVVFSADKDLDERYDLYLAMLDGSEVFRINDPLIPGGYIYDFSISPDRNYIAYSAIQDTLNVIELYVASAAGTGVVKVSPAMQPNNYISSINWAEDSSRIAFIAKPDSGSTHELYSNLPSGLSLQKVSGPLVTGGRVGGYSWAPDSSLLAYTADQNTAGITELFISQPDGSDNIRVSAPISSNGVVNNYGFSWAPDASRIAYSVYDYSTGNNTIYSSYPDGTGNEHISHPTLTNNFINSGIKWAPDGSRIAYSGYYYYYNTSTFIITHYDNLFTVEPNGNGVTQVSAIPQVYGESRALSDFAWAPDSSRIAYEADQDIDNVIEIFASGPDGDSNVRVSGPIVSGGYIYTYTFKWAPDSSHIAYLAAQESTDRGELFTSDPFGNNNTTVSGELVEDGNVSNFEWSADSAYLGYVADQRQDGRYELFTAIPDGSLNPRVSGNLHFDGDVQGFKWSVNADRLVYRADQLEDNKYELFVAAPDGSVLNDNISGPLTTDGDVMGFITQ